MKYIVWLYLTAAVGLSIIFCLNFRMLDLSGIYSAKVHIYNENDSIKLDTTFRTFVIVNCDYQCDYCLRVKWTFDKYLDLGRKQLVLPNVLRLKFSPDFEHVCSNFVILNRDRGLRPVKSLITRKSLILSFMLIGQNVRIDVKGYR